MGTVSIGCHAVQVAVSTHSGRQRWYWPLAQMSRTHATTCTLQVPALMPCSLRACSGAGARMQWALWLIRSSG